MDELLGFFLTPGGATLSGVCTIASLIFGLFQKSRVTNLSNKIEAQNSSIITLQAENLELSQHNTLLTDSNNQLKIQNSDLTSKINKLENGNINTNKQTVKQRGKNNVNNGNVNGDVNLHLS